MIADTIIDFSFLMCDIAISVDGQPAQPGQDREVDLADWNHFTVAYGQTPPPGGWGYMDGDFNYDGVVTLPDFNMLAGRFGNYLPDRMSGPDSVSVSLIGATNTLNLNWWDAVDGETGYRIQRSTDGQVFSVYEDVLPPYEYSSPPDFGEGGGEPSSGGVITWTDSEVLDGQRYWYRVRAFGNGQDTGYTPKKAATTKLLAPSNLEATEIGAAIALVTWTNESSTADGFKIFRSDDGGQTWIPLGNTSQTTFGGTIASWDDDPLFMVRAYRGDPGNPTVESVDSLPVPVTPATPTVPFPVDIPPTITGSTAELTVLGHVPRGESFLTYTWTATSKPAGAPDPIFTPNGTNAAKYGVVTFYKAGPYTLTVTIANGDATAVSSASTTVVQTLTSIAVNPGFAVLENNATQQFSATGFDQFGDDLTSQPTFTWTRDSGGTGSVSGTGLYTAPTSGAPRAIVRASAGGKSGSALIAPEQQLSGTAPQGGQTLYSATFDDAPVVAPGVDAAWSVSNTSTTPAGGRVFLGRFHDGQSTTTLTLANLPNHSYLTISFNLYVIMSWDGNTTGGIGPDSWRLAVDGTTRLNTTFSNFTSTQFQAYSIGNPNGNFPARTDAAENNTLGYLFIGLQDSVYRITLVLRHAGTSAAIQFSSATTTTSGYNPIDDESWGLDDVSVSVQTPDLDVDSDNDGSIAEADDPIEDDSDKPGVIIHLNDDDDDNNGMPDWQQSGTISSENIAPPEGMTEGTLKLRIASGHNRVRVWSSPQRSGNALLGLGATAEEISWNIGQQPATVWLEGVGAGSAAIGDVRFALIAIQTAPTRITIDPVRATTQPATTQPPDRMTAEVWSPAPRAPVISNTSSRPKPRDNPSRSRQATSRTE